MLGSVDTAGCGDVNRATEGYRESCLGVELDVAAADDEAYATGEATAGADFRGARIAETRGVDGPATVFPGALEELPTVPSACSRMEAQVRPHVG